MAQVAVEIGVKQIPEQATKSWVESFGIIDGGLELMRQACPGLEALYWSLKMGRSFYRVPHFLWLKRKAKKGNGK